MLKNIILFLNLGILSSFISSTYSRVDKELEYEIAREYQEFKSHYISGLTHQPCKAIQFVYDLQEKLQKTHDKHIAEKIAAIVSEGAGVGGIDTNRQATEDEEKIIYGALYAACRTDTAFIHELLKLENNQKESNLRTHRARVYCIYKASQENNFSLNSVDFFRDIDSYLILKKLVEELIEKECPRYSKNYQRLIEAIDRKEADYIDGVIKEESLEYQRWIIKNLVTLYSTPEEMSSGTIRGIFQIIVFLEDKGVSLIDDNLALIKKLIFHPKLKQQDRFSRYKTSFCEKFVNTILFNSLFNAPDGLNPEKLRVKLEGLLKILGFCGKDGIDSESIEKILGNLANIPKELLPWYIDQLKKTSAPNERLYCIGYRLEDLNDLYKKQNKTKSYIEDLTNYSLKIFPPSMEWSTVYKGSKELKSPLSYLDDGCKGDLKDVCEYTLQLITQADSIIGRQMKLNAVAKVSSINRKKFVDFILDENITDFLEILKLSNDWPNL